VLLGVPERLEFLDAPGHVADLARGDAIRGNRRVTAFFCSSSRTA
jgi:hypothetical protein